MLMIFFGIKWPNDTTTPKSYLIFAPSDSNDVQSRHSMLFSSAYCFTGLPFALNDVTTSTRLMFELTHFLEINQNSKSQSKSIRRHSASLISKLKLQLKPNYSYRELSNNFRLCNEKWSVPKNNTFNFNCCDKLVELKRIKRSWPSNVLNFLRYLNNNRQFCIANVL